MSCGLNLTDPRTARVLELSTRIVSLVDERADVLLRLHRDAAESAFPSPAIAAHGPASVPVAVTPVETAWPAPAPLPEEAGGRAQPPLTPVPRPAGDGVAASIVDAPVSAPPVAEAPARPVPSSVPSSPPLGEPPVAGPAEPRKPRRSSVQVFLLSVGVVLLAVAAAFFLTVAWISGGLVLRSIIIGLITAVVIATASLLRRRGLGATAEGIALLGMALVGLDAWAVRANDVGGSASADANVFWGATMVGAGLAFVGWARLSRLRSPLSAAVIALAVGPAVLAAGAVDRDTAAGWYVWGLVLVVVALAAPLAPRLARPQQTPVTVEIAVVRGLAALGAIAASVAALVIDPRSVATPAALSVPLAVALGVHAWSFARRGAARLAPIAAVLAVLSLGVGIAATAVRSTDATLSVTVPLLVAAAIALALDAAARRAPTGLARTTLVTAAVSAAVGAALAALAPISWALTAFGAPLRQAVGVFRRPALGVDIPDAGSTASVIALVAVVVLAVVVWRMSGSWAVRRQLAWGLVAGGALLAGPQLRVVLLVVGWYLALAVIAVVVLRRRRDDVALAAVTGILALGGGWLMSFSSPLTWGLATIVVVGVLAAAAGVHPGLRVASSVGVVLFVSGSALLMPMAVRLGADVIVPGTSPFIAALAAASLCLAVLVAPVSRRAGLDEPQRGAGAIAALGVVVAAAPLAALFRTGWAAHVWLLAALGLAAAAAAVLLAPPYRSWRVTRPIAALLAPLLTAGASGAALALVEAAPLARVIVLAALVVLVAAAALRLLAAERSTRLIVDAGTAIVGVVAVVTAPSGGVRWVPLLLVAVAAVLWATDADGLFTSRGSRRHLLWVALGVGTLALWTRLFWQGTGNVEPFTLPVGLAVLGLAAGHERARRLMEGRSVAAPAIIAGAGMSIALLPSALVSTDDPLRVFVVGVVSVVILLGGAALRPPRTPDALPVAVATSGALALVLLTVSQVATDFARLPARLGVADLTTVVTTAALAGAAIAVSRRPAGWALPAARVAAITATSILALAATTLVAGDGGPVVRAVGAAILLGSIGVIALRFEHRLLGLPLAGTALGGAGLVALVGVGADIRPLEGMTVPVALAWLAAALLRRPRALTPALTGLAAAGLAVGLLPSALIADSSLVRAIGVIVAAVVVLAGAVIGARGSLAPLLAPALGIASLALITASSLRALRVAGTPWFDVWMLATSLPLVGAALLVRRRRAGGAAWVPTTLVVTALAVVVGLSSVRVAAVPGETSRVVVTLVAVLILGVLWRGTHERIVFWAAVGLAAVFSVAALLAGAADPVEAVTIPVAGALLFSGARALRTRHDLRTWPALGVGLALLLVPSLLFDFSDDNALWRVIALGVIALAILLVGVRYRLQAPVLLGGVVLIVHAFAQLWPWITSLYESASGLWWLWLGIAGVVLIVVAATYERRIREVKAVALAIRSLR